ncbi:MAG: ABC transporter permease subunit [Planctomycetota bacterium]
MRQLAAVLYDSYLECRDRSALRILLLLSICLIVLCFGFSLKMNSMDVVLKTQVHQFDLFTSRNSGGTRATLINDISPSVGEIHAVTREDHWPTELDDGWVVELAFSDLAQLDMLANHWRSFNNQISLLKQEPADRIAFMEDRFKQFGYNHVCVRLAKESPPTYRVAVKSDYPYKMMSADSMSLLFGLINLPQDSSMSVVETMVNFETILADAFAGLIGMVVVILVCAAFVPNMLQKGTLALVLARPIGRGRLLLYKYVGSLCFILIMATFLIGGCWLGLSIRTGYWNPWFLACILTITALFAIIHSVSVLFGVLTRSSTAAALLALGVWIISGAVASARDVTKFGFGEHVSSTLKTTIEVVYTILPKTTDIGYLNALFLSKSSSQAVMHHGLNRVPSINWTFSLGTTVAFTAVMLFLAVWYFRRQDY